MRIISGAFGGRRLKTVEGPGYRPAMGRVREALFSLMEARGVVWSACTVLDVFAGSGSLAFEALSRGAVYAQLVELAPQAVKCLHANAALLGLDSARLSIVRGDAARHLGRACPRPFSVVFVDPPYGQSLLPATLRTLLRRGWLAPGGMLVAEVESRVPFDSGGYPPLECLAERTFGQTRVIAWTLPNTASESTPVPSIP